MMKPVRYALFLIVTVISMLVINSCSKDDTPVTPPDTSSSTIYIDMKSNAQFKYNNTELDSLNNPTATTWQYEAYTKKGSFILGAYNDWFYRIGTDKRDDSKDTIYVRVNTGSASGSSFTKEVQMYGFSYQIHMMFVRMVLGMLPTATLPSIPGETWDVVAMYHDQNGAAYDVGKEWTIGNVIGLDLGFTIPGFPLPLTVNIKISGKLDSKGESYKNGSIDCKAWKSTVSVTLTSTFFKQPTVIKFSMWLSDNPDGIVKTVQQSATIEFADILKSIVGNGFTILGDKSESYEYTE